MKDLDSFLGIIYMIIVAAGCKLVGKLFGEGVHAGILFIALAIGMISILYWQLSKTKD
jgi:hypothetical protein